MLWDELGTFNFFLRRGTIICDNIDKYISSSPGMMLMMYEYHNMIWILNGITTKIVWRFPIICMLLKNYRWFVTLVDQFFGLNYFRNYGCKVVYTHKSIHYMLTAKIVGSGWEIVWHHSSQLKLNFIGLSEMK